MKTLFKKLTLGAMVASMAVTGLLTASTARAADPVTVRIFVGLGTGADEAQRAGQLELEKAWNAANSDIKIKFDFNANVTAKDVFLTQLASDNPPDIAGPAGIPTTSIYPGIFADLAPYIEKDKADLKLSDYDAQVLKLFQTNSGQNLSLALGIYPSFLWVNEDAFKTAEVPLPPKKFGEKYKTKDGKEVVWDWTTLAEVAKSVTQDSNGKFGDEKDFDPTKITTYGYGEWWAPARSAFVRFGVTDAGVAKDGKTATWKQDAAVAAVNWFHDGVYKDHFIPDATAQNSLTQAATPFQSGRLAMWFSHTWYLCCMSGTKFNWSAYALPAVPGTEGKQIVAPLNADTFFLLSKSKNKDAAWKVLKWLNSAENASALCKIYGCIPARISARTAWETDMKAKEPRLDIKVVYEAAKYADVPSNEGYMPNFPQAWDAANAFWGTVFSKADLNTKSALEDFNGLMQRIYDGKEPTPTPKPSK